MVRRKGMDYYDLWKRATHNILARYTSVITKEGVLILPKECLAGKIIEEDGYPVFLTNSLAEGLLCIYSIDSFDETCNALSRLNSMDQNVRYLKRRIIAEAIKDKIDKSGHVNIEDEFLTRLGFDTNQGVNKEQTEFPVMILEYPNKIEIVSSTLYEELKADINQ